MPIRYVFTAFAPSPILAARSQSKGRNMQTRAWSPSFDSVRKAADAALKDENGITVNFRLETYTTPEACASAARSFQQLFTSLRARVRRTSEKILGERNGSYLPPVSAARGAYDNLVCERRPLRGGEWCIRLIPSHMHLADVEIVSNTTGEPIEEVGANAEFANRVRVFTSEHLRRKMPGEGDKPIPVHLWDELTEIHRAMHPDAETLWYQDADGSEWWPRSRCVGAQPLITDVGLLYGEREDNQIAALTALVEKGGSLFGED